MQTAHLFSAFQEPEKAPHVGRLANEKRCEHEYLTRFREGLRTLRAALPICSAANGIP